MPAPRATIDIDPAFAHLVREGDRLAKPPSPTVGNDESGFWNSQLIPKQKAARASMEWLLHWKASTGSPEVRVGVFRLSLVGLLKAGIVRREGNGGLRLNVFHIGQGLFLANSPTETRIRIAWLTWAGSADPTK